MPSVSKKQHNLMAAVAHNPAFAKKVGIKQSVGKEFTAADKGKKFKEGGMAESKAMVKKEVSFMKKKGAPKSMIKHEMGEMKNTSRMNRLEELGRVDAEKATTAKGKKNLMAEKKRVVGELKMAKGGMAASKMGKVKTAAPSRDGIAIKGKTKGAMPKMAGSKGMKKGGYC